MSWHVTFPLRRLIPAPDARMNFPFFWNSWNAWYHSYYVLSNSNITDPNTVKWIQDIMTKFLNLVNRIFLENYEIHHKNFKGYNLHREIKLVLWGAQPWYNQPTRYPLWTKERNVCLNRSNGYSTEIIGVKSAFRSPVATKHFFNFEKKIFLLVYPFDCNASKWA